MERAKKIKEKITESSIPIFIWSGEKAKRNEEEKRKKQQTGKPPKIKERATFLLRFMSLSFLISGNYLLLLFVYSRSMEKEKGIKENAEYTHHTQEQPIWKEKKD